MDNFENEKDLHKSLNEHMQEYFDQFKDSESNFEFTDLPPIYLDSCAALMHMALPKEDPRKVYEREVLARKLEDPNG